GAQVIDRALHAASAANPATASHPGAVRGSGAGPTSASASTTSQATSAPISRGSVKKAPEKKARTVGPASSKAAARASTARRIRGRLTRPPELNASYAARNFRTRTISSSLNERFQSLLQFTALPRARRSTSPTPAAASSRAAATPSTVGRAAIRFGEIAVRASGVLFSKLFVTVSIPADAISIGTRLRRRLHLP